jgi:hypothetical protein
MGTVIAGRTVSAKGTHDDKIREGMAKTKYLHQ